MNQLDLILALREGGQTTRCHTMQYVGPYNVAIHSYNALMLLLALYPEEPRIELVRAVMFHDTPERWTGDMPTPVKTASPTLRTILNMTEQLILNKLGLGNLFTDITKQERDWLNAVDLLELFIWANEQQAMGNYSAVPMIIQIWKIFESRKESTPIEVQNYIKNFSWRRTEECSEFI